jgi:hypothetical protein
MLEIEPYWSGHQILNPKSIQPVPPQGRNRAHKFESKFYGPEGTPLQTKNLQLKAAFLLFDLPES